MRTKTIISIILTLCTQCAVAKNYRVTDFFMVHPMIPNTAFQIYFDNSLSSNPRAMCQKKNKVPWQLSAIDEEGGTVVRFRGTERGITIPEPPQASESTNLKMEDFIAKVDAAAKYMKNKCVDINLAPVADSYGMQNRDFAFKDRSYSEDISTVIRYATAFSDEIRKNGIVPTWKHFPGIPPSVKIAKKNPLFKNNQWESSEAYESKNEVIRRSEAFKSNHSDLLMISNTIYKEISKYPAVLVPELVELAKYSQPNSLIITDDVSEINMSDIQMLWLFKNMDLIMFLNVNDAVRMEKLIEKAIADGRITEKEIESKRKRQNDWRQRNNLPLLPPL